MNALFMPLRAATHIVDLEPEQLLVFENAARAEVRVLSGAVWLTRDCDRRDHLATAGESIELPRRTRCVLAALAPTRIEIQGLLRGAPQLRTRPPEIWRLSPSRTAPA